MMITTSLPTKYNIILIVTPVQTLRLTYTLNRCELIWNTFSIKKINLTKIDDQYYFGIIKYFVSIFSKRSLRAVGEF